MNKTIEQIENSTEQTIFSESENSVNENSQNDNESKEFNNGILKIYNEILEICKEEGKSIPQLIKEFGYARKQKRKEELLEKCSGDDELAKHILNLESKVKHQKDDFDEIKKYFPQIKNIESLPQSVVNNANLRGTLLLDEYLRYLLEEKIKTETAISEQDSAANASTGTQTTHNSEINAEAAEFLRGLWK